MAVVMGAVYFLLRFLKTSYIQYSRKFALFIRKRITYTLYYNKFHTG
jgi:hypothetical protein